eukprot:4896029-Alexandrium_andersonii.AAC.1
MLPACSRHPNKQSNIASGVRSWKCAASFAKGAVLEVPRWFRGSYEGGSEEVPKGFPRGFRGGSEGVSEGVPRDSD